MRTGPEVTQLNRSALHPPKELLLNGCLIYHEDDTGNRTFKPDRQLCSGLERRSWIMYCLHRPQQAVRAKYNRELPRFPPTTGLTSIAMRSCAQWVVKPDWPFCQVQSLWMYSAPSAEHGRTASLMSTQLRAHCRAAVRVCFCRGCGAPS